MQIVKTDRHEYHIDQKNRKLRVYARKIVLGEVVASPKPGTTTKKKSGKPPVERGTSDLIKITRPELKKAKKVKESERLEITAR